MGTAVWGLGFRVNMGITCTDSHIESTPLLPFKHLVGKEGLRLAGDALSLYKD